MLGVEKVENDDTAAAGSRVPTYTREKTLLILICPNVSPPLKVRIHSDFGLEIKRRLA